jgi:multidrug resistance efflux pump
MRHFNPIPIIALLVLAGFAYGGWRVDQNRAAQRSVLSGYFESQPAELASRVGGRVANIRVKEGQSVKKGQELLELDADPAQLQASALSEQAEQARQALLEAQHGSRPEDIERQAAVVREAEANLAKLLNGPRPEEIAQARAKLKTAEAQYDKAKAGPRPQEIAEARAAERNAQAKLDQVVRGLTPEEKAEAKAKLDAAAAQENLAQKSADRMEALYRQGAVSRQDADRAEADLNSALANQQGAEAAWERAMKGSTAEELDQAREAHRQAKAALDLALAGTRKEDIEAAAGQVEDARQALRTLLAGSRKEDIEAARARLSQARSALDELQAGSRKEQIAQAAAAAKAAKETAKSSKANVEDRILRAPEDGIIERVLVSQGDLIAVGTQAVRMSDPRDIWLRVYVPESKLARVTADDEAQLQIDGIASPVTAYVESIATQGEFTPANLQTPEERGKQSFAVRLRLKRFDSRIKAGMFATVKRIGSWTP